MKARSVPIFVADVAKALYRVIMPFNLFVYCSLKFGMTKKNEGTSNTYEDTATPSAMTDEKASELEALKAMFDNLSPEAQEQFLQQAGK